MIPGNRNEMRKTFFQLSREGSWRRVFHVGYKRNRQKFNAITTHILPVLPSSGVPTAGTFIEEQTGTYRNAEPELPSVGN